MHYAYFFSGNQYIRVHRDEVGAGTVSPGYPKLISGNWGFPAGFGANGIDAALYSGSVCYFFKGNRYIRVTRGTTGPGDTSKTYGPAPISEWGWPAGFGTTGIDAALWSGSVVYFFSGNRYIRVNRRSDTDFGTMSPGYPKTIASGWGWNAPFANRIKGALPSGSRCYFFSGNQYLRVSRGFELAGFIDKTYPKTIVPNWHFPTGFGTNGIDAALYSGGPLTAAGPSGLTSNSNYYLVNDGKNILNFSTTIAIDNDLISASNGFGFQINCQTAEPLGSSNPCFQQYILFTEPGNFGLEAWLYNFTRDTSGAFQKLVEKRQVFATLPADDRINASSALTMNLLNDSNGNITGCKYSYTAPDGTQHTTSFNIDSNITKAPIPTITLNLVADYNSGHADISGGQGTIKYSASSPLTAVGNVPSWAPNIWTAETANVVYEQLPVGAVSVSQLWGQAPTDWAAPKIGEIHPMATFAPAKSPGKDALIEPPANVVAELKKKMGNATVTGGA